MSCRGTPGAQPATIASAAAFASAVSRSRFIVMPSLSRRNPSSRACAALSLTLPKPIRSKARLASPSRSSISLQPPPAGIRPTPVSTSPMYVSAAACTRAGVQHHFAAAAQRHAERRRHHRPRRVLHRHARRLETPHREIEFVPFAFLRGQQHLHEIGADAEVLAVVGHHQRLKSALHFTPARSSTICTMSSPSAFILLWNSRHSTPSPRSISDAPAIGLHHAARALEIAQHHHAGTLVQRRGTPPRSDRSSACRVRRRDPRI